MKRLLVISDLHCGHLIGLTPPRWQTKATGSAVRSKRDKLSSVQKEAWRWYIKHIKEYGPYDCVVVNGDAIDGAGKRSGGTEQITADREEQCEIAVECIEKTLPKNRKDCKLVMTYGTGYHTGDEEDWENKIARDLKANKIGSHEWVNCAGVVFDFKHQVGSSGIPHGRHTAINKESLWANLWAERGLIPEADVLIRSHVHYHAFCGDTAMKPMLRMTTPALQAMGSKYGSRRCSGIVDFGFIVFECDRGKLDNWVCVRDTLKSQRATALEV
ncbi:MAG: hypothetical protein GY906_23885 [bacterium]|nr:hypothetical protein [bacterium]